MSLPTGENLDLTNRDNAGEVSGVPHAAYRVEATARRAAGAIR